MSPLPRRTPVLRPSLRTSLRTLFVTTLSVAVASVALSAPAHAENRVTPGDFTGYGFDQCLAPTQAKMDAWMENSPFTAVGIYISGASRACRSQPNLTTTWISTQLRKGWRLLPITLGPQSSCVGRFPRYGASIDPTIKESSTSSYAAARKQGTAEAKSAVAVAKRLGITAGSTLWYDLEGWSNVNDASCRESALSFLQAWTTGVHDLGYVSGVYSSAGSGMVILDNARKTRPDYVLPDRIWIARWDGVANTSTSYISDDGWLPGGRMKQYKGGHNETWGGVTINIDSNYLDLGKGSVLAASRPHCGSIDVDLAAYPGMNATTSPKATVQALQCLLKERGFYPGTIDGTWSKATVAAMNAWQRKAGLRVSGTWTKRAWVVLLSSGFSRTLKYGAAAPVVRRLQRALVAATGTEQAITGVLFRSTENLIRTWQGRVGLPKNGIMNAKAWALLKRGTYY